jgi:FAD/FMN-containing dehydrogenase
VSSPGIAGLTLRGGFGWLLRKYGMACDNLLSADVVADGQLVTASEEHEHLFWALRGGGGNFGVVTSFEDRLHPVGPTVFAGPVFYPSTDAAPVLRGWRDLAATTPDELTTIADLLVASPPAGPARGGARPARPGRDRPVRRARGGRRTGHAVAADLW